jgi:DNA cross-link repair 1B protein
VYFLSHCHEDHLRGLSNNWSQGKIYMSYLSKKLIVDRFPDLKDYVVDLEMDEEHWIYLDEEKKEGVQVVLMDAFHCPGAVMFLFKGKMGTVLHTGDFRFSEEMLKNDWLCPVERRNPQFKGITVDVDVLHLDNTFANPEYDFPSREEAYVGLKKVVQNHLDHRIFLFSYNLGKEEVFLNLAEDFKSLIVVDEDRLRKIKLMELRPELFTTDPTKSKIHIRSIRDLKGHE